MKTQSVQNGAYRGNGRENLMNKTEIPFLTAAELSHKIRDKEISPTEVVAAYIERIENINPILNSYITICSKHALDKAKHLEKALMQGEYRGPFHGIPVAVKDQWWTKGIRTTGGSRTLVDFVPEKDSTVMEYMDKAGGILLGKTNMTEFAMGATFDFPFGIPRNPWNIQYGVGGSSAGSGSAVAAHLTATALGEDTTGSIRTPSCYNGIVGLRPTWGLVSRYGMMGHCWSFDTIGPMSKTVEDCALTLQAIAGYDPKDQYSSKQPVPNYLKTINKDISGLRVGVIQETMSNRELDPEVRSLVSNAIKDIESLGVCIDQISLPLIEHAGAISAPISFTECSRIHKDNISNNLGLMDHTIELNMLTGTLIPAQTYYKAQRLRELWRKQALDALKTYDILLQPTCATFAPKIGPRPNPGTRTSEKIALYGNKSLRTPWSLIGNPALSLPCGFGTQGLPTSIQVIGRHFQEETIFALGHAFEKITNWTKHNPTDLNKRGRIG